MRARAPTARADVVVRSGPMRWRAVIAGMQRAGPELVRVARYVGRRYVARHVVGRAVPMQALGDAGSGLGNGAPYRRAGPRGLARASARVLLARIDTPCSNGCVT